MKTICINVSQELNTFAAAKLVSQIKTNDANQYFNTNKNGGWFINDDNLLVNNLPTNIYIDSNLTEPIIIDDINEHHTILISHISNL